MKRVLSLILVVMLVMGSFPVFADESTYGEMLQGMGLVNGDELGNLNEGMTITRAEMMVLLAEMYGVLDEAANFPLDSSFKDVDPLKWYAPFIAYAQVEGWTSGYDVDTFGPLDVLTADMAATFILRVLGYQDPADFTYEGALEFAASMGIDIDEMLVNEGSILRSEVFELMYDALFVKTTDGVLLGVTLGVIGEPEGEAVEVVEINVLNLKQVEVVFNTPLDDDSAEDANNYEIDDHSLEAQLGDDEMTVMLTIDPTTEIVALIYISGSNSFDNQEEFTLLIDGVMNVDESDTLEDYESELLEAFDNTVPEALSCEMTATDVFEITFSEPIDPLESEIDIEIDGGIIGTSFIDVDMEVVTVSLQDELEEGTYEVVVSGVFDYAGFEALEETFDMEYAEENESPIGSIDSANETEVVIVFNEDIYFSDEDGEYPDFVEDYFYHSYSNYNPDDVTLDGDEITLTFDTYPLPEGTVKIVIEYDDEYFFIEDGWGNAIEEDVVFYENVVVDQDAPEITEIETEDLDQNVFEIYFNEALNFDELDSFDVEDYVVLTDDDDEDIEIEDLFYWEDEDEDEYYIEVIVTDEDDYLFEGIYTLEVMGFEDDSILENEMEAVTMTVEKEDTTSPFLSEAEAFYMWDEDNNEITFYVYYPEDMATEGKYSILEKENYLLGMYEMDDDDTLEIFKEVDVVKAVVELEDDEHPMDVFGYPVLRMARMADEAGNKSVELYYEIEGMLIEPPMITAVETIDDKTIEITVDGILTTVTADGLLVGPPVPWFLSEFDDRILLERTLLDSEPMLDTLAAVEFYYNDDDETIITGTLKADQQLEYPYMVPEFVVVLEDEWEDERGVYMWENEYDLEYITDGYAPSFDDDAFEDYNPDSLIYTETYVEGSMMMPILFDEPLIPLEVEANLMGEISSFDFTVVYDDEELVAMEDYAVVSGEFLLMIMGDDILFDDPMEMMEFYMMKFILFSPEFEFEIGEEITITCEDAQLTTDFSENPVNDFEIVVEIADGSELDDYPYPGLEYFFFGLVR